MIYDLSVALKRPDHAAGGSAAGGDIGETVYATCNTLLEKLPAARQRNSE